MVITSLDNNYIKKIKKLKEKKYRDSNNSFLIEGIHLVEEAFKANILKEIIVLEGEYFEINAPITYVSKNVMKKLSGMDSYPKIIGICDKLKEKELGNKLLILEDIQDPGNLGTIIRSSLAFDIDTIILSSKTVDMYNDKVLRSTQGMMFHINIIVRELDTFIKEIKKDNYLVYGTKVDGGNDIRNMSLSNKFAIIIGNEGQGISNNISNLCDDYLYIKMNDKVESLNAGVATSILLYEVYNKWN